MVQAQRRPLLEMSSLAHESTDEEPETHSLISFHIVPAFEEPGREHLSYKYICTIHVTGKPHYAYRYRSRTLTNYVYMHMQLADPKALKPAP